MNDELQKLLDVDPFKEAERLLGDSDEDPSKLGFALALINNTAKNELLSELKDTRFSTPLDEYLEVAARLGFEIILREDFSKPDIYRWQDNLEVHYETPYQRMSQYYVLWNKEDSALLYFSTFPIYKVDQITCEISIDSESINGGHFCYNWKTGKDRWSYTSSGSYYKPEEMTWDEFNEIPDAERIWAGDHDCREALAHNYMNLKTNGVFVKEWKKAPFYTMLHPWERDVMESGISTGDELTAARIAKFPKEVRDIIAYS